MQGHNNAFIGDPFAYVSRYAINHLSMKLFGELDAYDFNDAPAFDERGRPIPGRYSAYNNGVNQTKGMIEAAKEGYFDLEPVPLQGRTSVFLRFVVPGQFAPPVTYGGLARGRDPAIRAYWLGYMMPGLQGAGKTRIPFVDLPKAGPAHPFMFTGAMNGCSMVVTQHPNDPTLLRVYHDSVHGRDTFRDDVVICRIDYDDEGYASANRREAVLAAPVVAPPVPAPRARSLSTGGPVVAPVARGRSASVSGTDGRVATPPAACIRFSYGDNAQYAQAHGGGGGVANTDVQVRTSFNFLYFDTATNHWVAVSQPLETQPTTAQPVKGWFESSEAFAERQKSFRRKGTQVAMPPARAPWREMIPY